MRHAGVHAGLHPPPPVTRINPVTAARKIGTRARGSCTPALCPLPNTLALAYPLHHAHACSYEDDRDEGEWFLYTGSGGRDLSGNKRTNKEQSFDQVRRSCGGRGWVGGCLEAAHGASKAAQECLQCSFLGLH